MQIRNKWAPVLLACLSIGLGRADAALAAEADLSPPSVVESPASTEEALPENFPEDPGPVAEEESPESEEAPPADQPDATQEDAAARIVVAGRVHFVAGRVKVLDQGGRVRELNRGDDIHSGDTVISDPGASAQIRLEDGGLIALRPETQLKFDSFEFSGKEDETSSNFLTLSKGGFRSVTGLVGRSNNQAYRVTTPTAILGVTGNAGTDHEIVYLAGDVLGALAGTYNKVNAGGSVMTNRGGWVLVEPDQMGYAGELDQLPQLQPVYPALFSDAPAPDTGETEDADQTILELPAAETPVVPLDQAAEQEGEFPDTPPAMPAEEEAEALFAPAPISWGGDVSVGYRKQVVTPGSTTLQKVQAANVRARSYIWQPWLARVRGGVGVVNSQSVYDEDASGDTRLVGNGALALFPQSRFPFDASFDVSDGSGVSSSTAPTVTMNTVRKRLDLRQRYASKSGEHRSEAKYGRRLASAQLPGSDVGRDSDGYNTHLRQDYRPQRSRSRYVMVYDRMVTDATSTGRSNLSSLTGSYSTRFEKQTLAVEMRRKESSWATGDTGRQSNGLTARHTYRPDAQLTVTSLAAVEQAQPINPVATSGGIQSLLGSASVTWQPEAELPFYVTGSGQYYNNDQDGGGAQSWVGSAGLRYLSSRNLRYEFHETLANTTTTQGGTIRSVLSRGSAIYTSDSTEFGDARHRWNGRAEVNHQTRTSSPANLGVTGGAGQSVNLPHELEGGAMLDFGISQSLLMRQDQSIGLSNTLTHRGDATWRPVPGEALSGMVSLNVSDIRSSGGDDPAHFQTIGLRGSVQNVISAYSRLEVRGSVQQNNDGRGRSYNNITGRFEYFHTQAFHVRGLKYSILFKVNEAESPIAPGMEDLIASRSSSTLEQKLDYRIGRAFVRFTGNAIRSGNVKSSLLYFQIGRYFGDA